MKQIRVTFSPDTPESYKVKTVKKILSLGWIQNRKKVQLIPAKDDPNQNMRDITLFFDWPDDSEAVYPVDIDFEILP